MSSRRGPLGVWIVHGTNEPTNFAEVDVEHGETLDFVAEFRGSDEAGGFSCSPVIQAIEAPDKTPAVWDAAKVKEQNKLNKVSNKSFFMGPRTNRIHWDDRVVRL